ncbi:MAG: ABC transporter permease, partial [Methanomicrobiaceae archaeon]|nr:ABC transporter permease [Methanomicrobiaceae archaeon]
MTFFEFAKRNLKRHWVRTLLAVIGIVIGVVAIATLGILGNSINLMVGDMVSDVGDTLVVTPAVSGGGMFGGVSGGKLSGRQVEDIARAAGSNRVIPIATAFDRLETGNLDRGVQIYAMHADDIPYLLERESGTFPKETTAGILIGKQLAEAGEKDGLRAGSRVQLGGETVRVLGVLEERGLSFDINPDYAVVVPYRWFSDRYDRNDYDQVIVKVRDVRNIDSVRMDIEDRMNRRDR